MSANCLDKIFSRCLKMAWDNKTQYQGWKKLEWMGHVDYCQWKLSTYNFDTIENEGVYEWWQGTLRSPKLMAANGPCDKCARDLQTFKKNKEITNLECSLPHCLWHEWFEKRRPKEWAKHYCKFIVKRFCKQK